MPDKFLQAKNDICAKLKTFGHEAYIVGGWCRERFADRHEGAYKDIDIATSAKPEELVKIFPGAKLIGKDFGVIQHEDFEIASFREDGRYVDLRHPESVKFGDKYTDAARRDFSCNSIYFDPISGLTFDPNNGIWDIEHRVLRCIGNAYDRLSEDPLRCLRAVRFAAKYEWEIAQETFDAIWKIAVYEGEKKILSISAERIREELTRIFLDHKNIRRALELLRITGILELILPEIARLELVEQSPNHHLEGNVWEHTLNVCEELNRVNEVTVWAALLHDVGKADTAKFKKDHWTFYGHDSVGAEISDEILRRLKFSNSVRENIVECVQRHMVFHQIKKFRESKFRLFASHKDIENQLAIARADCLGSIQANGKCHSTENCEFVESKIAQYGNELVPATRLVTGKDLLESGICEPNKVLGKTLNHLFLLQLEGKISSKEQGLKIAKNFVKSQQF